jgi:hypothetical protein
MIGWSSPSDAYIQRIVIDQTATVNFTLIILGTSTPGPAASDTIYTGRVFGELKPNDPNNKIIIDIDLAPKNKGRVEYVANFEIITPSDLDQCAIIRRRVLGTSCSSASRSWQRTVPTSPPATRRHSTRGIGRRQETRHSVAPRIHALRVHRVVWHPPLRGRLLPADRLSQGCTIVTD